MTSLTVHQAIQLITGCNYPVLVQKDADVFLGNFGQSERVECAPSLRIAPSYAVAQCILLLHILNFIFYHGCQQFSQDTIRLHAHIPPGV